MIEILKSLLGLGSTVDYTELKKQGAIILDVRTRGEFSMGHIRGSINIPVESLSNNTARLDKSKPIITCCASGMRSRTAKSILKAKGYPNVHNGGSWMSLQNKLK